MLILSTSIVLFIEPSLQTWGAAYGRPDELIPQFIVKPFTATEHDIPMIGYPLPHLQHTYQILPGVTGLSEINWPDATSHPYFYIGVYAAIGFANALTSVLSVTALYTGALRASRILFK